MNSVRTLLQALAPVILAIGISAQSTLVVDATGGGDFTDIQSAVDAASPGGLIRVRHGEYQGAVIRKPLRIIGDPGQGGADFVHIKDGVFDVEGIGKGQSLVMTNLEGINQGIASFVARDCQGSIHLQSISATLDIRNCAYVTVSKSESNGDLILNNGVPGAVIEDSHVVMTDVLVRSVFTQPAMIVTRSKITLIKSIVEAWNNFPGPGGAGIKLEDSQFLHAGTFVGAACGPLGVCPPHVEFIGNSTVESVVFNSITVDHDTSELRPHASGSDPAAILVSLAQQPLPLPPGDLYLDAPNSIFFWTGIPKSQTRVPLPMPLEQQLGIPITFQGGVIDPDRGFVLTTPYTLVY